MPTREKKYQKENDAYVANLDSKMQEFYGVISDKFTDIRLTSGKREKADGDSHSHHHTGNAIDFGRENYQVYNYLLNDKEGLELMVNYGYGIIDETDPKELAKTKAKRPHFHLGIDPYYRDKAIKRLTNFDKVEPVQSFYESNPLFDYKAIENAKGDKSPDPIPPVPNTADSSVSVPIALSCGFTIVIPFVSLANRLSDSIAEMSTSLPKSLSRVKLSFGL